MIYLELFLTFLQIGAVSFGGGYAMISLIREQVLSHNWLSESDFLNIVAVSESTPGPIAVNMATFIGASQGGLLGSFIATLGVVLPSFFIILLIATLIRNLLKYKGVEVGLYALIIFYDSSYMNLPFYSTYIISASFLIISFIISTCLYYYSIGKFKQREF